MFSTDQPSKKRRRHPTLLANGEPTAFEKKLTKLVSKSYFEGGLATTLEGYENGWVKVIDMIGKNDLENQAMFLFFLATTQDAESQLRILNASANKVLAYCRSWLKNCIKQINNPDVVPYRKRRYKEMLNHLIKSILSLPVTKDMIKKHLKPSKSDPGISSCLSDNSSLSKTIRENWQALKSFKSLENSTDGFRPLTYNKLIAKFGTTSEEKKKANLSAGMSLPIVNPELSKHARKVPLPSSRLVDSGGNANSVVPSSVGKETPTIDKLALRLNPQRNKRNKGKSSKIRFLDTTESKSAPVVSSVDRLGQSLKKRPLPQAKTAEGKSVSSDSSKIDKVTTAIKSECQPPKRVIWADSTMAVDPLKVTTYGGWGLVRKKEYKVVD
mmetsp:Transcript_6575/g.8593  ORF Transcript_6575/g.8593 Transcript_6575/m.8593 type:complete len:384 (-) Transcript_6575:598-1749(-)